jgi:hypothetical protein
MFRAQLWLVLILVGAGACSESAPRGQPSPTHSVASPKPSISMTLQPDRWRRFASREIGLSFDFPPLTGEFTYEFEDRNPNPECPDPYYSWEVMRTDEPDPGHRYWFAGSTHCQKQGRGSWPTDVAKWGRDSRGYWVETGGPFRNREQVLAVKVLATTDGSRALVFKPAGLSSDECGEPDCPSQKDRTVAINFTREHGGFTSLVFYFRDITSLGDIERVVRSVTFSS